MNKTEARRALKDINKRVKKMRLVNKDLGSPLLRDEIDDLLAEKRRIEKWIEAPKESAA